MSELKFLAALFLSVFPVAHHTYAMVIPVKFEPLAYERACLEAQRVRKPLLLLWTFSSCVPCMKFKRNALKHPEVEKALGAFFFVAVDAESAVAQSWEQHFSLNSFPVLLHSSSKGKELARLDGDHSVSEVLDFLRAASSSNFTDCNKQKLIALIEQAVNRQTFSPREATKFLEQAREYGACREARLEGIDHIIYKLPKIRHTFPLAQRRAFDRLYRQLLNSLRRDGELHFLLPGHAMLTYCAELNTFGPFPAARKKKALQAISQRVEKLLSASETATDLEEFLYLFAATKQLGGNTLALALVDKSFDHFSAKHILYEIRADILGGEYLPILAAYLMAQAWEEAKGAITKIGYARRWVSYLCDAAANEAELFYAIRKILIFHQQEGIETGIYHQEFTKLSRHLQGWVAQGDRHLNLAEIKKSIVSKKDLQEWLRYDIEHFADGGSIGQSSQNRASR